MHSMTGFGRSDHQGGNWLVSVEATSVNRKQLEVVLQLPRALASLEADIRAVVGSHFSRGRIQLSFHFQSTAATEPLSFDKNIAKSVDDAFVKLSEFLGRSVKPTAADFLRLPNFLLSEAEAFPPLETALELILPALTPALLALSDSRATEGRHLRKDLNKRLEILVSNSEEITRLAQNRSSKSSAQLKKRLADLGLEIDLSDERFVREIAFFADRCDISEELIRLQAHFSTFKKYLGSEQAVGRAMDFLCQEISRELNTIGSKANDSAIAQIIVDSKTELEKIREQIQNVE